MAKIFYKPFRKIQQQYFIVLCLFLSMNWLSENQLVERKRTVFDNNSNKQTEQLTIGYANYRRTIPQAPITQTDKKFIHFMLNCTDQELNNTFNRKFPFFMLNMDRLHKSIQKNYKRISKNQSELLKEFYSRWKGYKYVWKRLFSRSYEVIIWTDYDYVGVSSRILFKNMVELKSESLVMGISEIGVLKNISHVRMENLKKLQIKLDLLYSLEPLMWMDMPNIEQLFLSLICVLTVKPFAHCKIDKLRQIHLEYIVQFQKNRTQIKNSVDMRPLSRTKIDRASDRQKILHDSRMLLYDLRDLVKLQWEYFDFPLNKTHFPNNLVTYNLNMKQMMRIRQRSSKPKTLYRQQIPNLYVEENMESEESSEEMPVQIRLNSQADVQYSIDEEESSQESSQEQIEQSQDFENSEGSNQFDSKYDDISDDVLSMVELAQKVRFQQLSRTVYSDEEDYLKLMQDFQHQSEDIEEEKQPGTNIKKATKKVKIQ